MQSSVSSQPTGRPPTRPIPSENPPTTSNTSRRKDMLAPIGLRTGPAAEGMPRYVQPTTQSNSSGKQRGRPCCQRGRTAPPTPITRGSR